MTSAISIGVALMFFVSIYVKPRSTSSPNLVPRTTVIYLSFFLGLILYFQNEPYNLVLWISGIATLGWTLYVFWYSRLGDRSSAHLAVGQNLPNLHFLNPEGHDLYLDDVSGAKVLVFFRGNWCPFCTAQIKEVAMRYDEIKALGAEVLFVSGQSKEHTRSLANKMNIKAHFLIDEELKVARQLGIIHTQGTPLGMEVLGYTSDSYLPTVIITDPNNKILYSDLTSIYRVRPHPAEFLRILRQA